MANPTDANRSTATSRPLEGSSWTRSPSLDGKSALSIRDLTKTYATGTKALGGVSLEMPAGDFFALLGPNGAGKTTVIGIVTGLVNKTGGEVSVFGENIDAHPQAARRHIGVVPQELNFNIFEKVIDIVVNQAGYYGIPRAVALPRAERLLEQLGLHDKRNDVSRTLSGGMKRRLMIARALIHQPSLLILDEPTAGVDVELRRGMWEFLQTLTAQGTTILLTTHYLEEAEQLCRHIAIINHGEIIATGTVKDILGRLQTETVLIDLIDADSGRAAELLSGYGARVLDSHEIEINLPSDAAIGATVVILENAGVAVKRIRSKAGRLEEVFMRLTARAKGNSS